MLPPSFRAAQPVLPCSSSSPSALSRMGTHSDRVYCNHSLLSRTGVQRGQPEANGEVTMVSPSCAPDRIHVVSFG